jgi:hypothetical protein
VAKVMWTTQEIMFVSNAFQAVQAAVSQLVTVRVVIMVPVPPRFLITHVTSLVR